MVMASAGVSVDATVVGDHAGELPNLIAGITGGAVRDL